MTVSVSLTLSPAFAAILWALVALPGCGAVLGAWWCGRRKTQGR